MISAKLQGRPPKITSAEQIMEIRRMRDEGYTADIIADRLGVSHATLYRHIKSTKNLSDDELRQMFTDAPVQKPTKPVGPLELPPPNWETTQSAPVGYDDAYVPCEWIAHSGWRSRQCSRMVKENSSGMSLCWQHEDGALHHVVSSLRGGDSLFAAHVDSLLTAILDWDRRVHRHDDARIRTLTPLVRTELKLRLKDMIDHDYVDPELAPLIDALIQLRLTKKWSEQ